MIRGKVTMKPLLVRVMESLRNPRFREIGIPLDSIPGPYGRSMLHAESGVKMTEGLKNTVKPCILKHMPKGLLCFSFP